MEDIFKDNSWKRHMDWDNDNTETLAILEERNMEKKYGREAKELIGIFFRNMNPDFKLKFNPYANSKQSKVAKQLVASMGFEAAKSKAQEMLDAYKADPKYCPRILMPTQMAEKMEQYEIYKKTRSMFKKKSLKAKLIGVKE